MVLNQRVKAPTPSNWVGLATHMAATHTGGVSYTYGGAIFKEHDDVHSDGPLKQKSNFVTGLRDYRLNNAYESQLDKILPRESVKLPPRSAVLRLLSKGIAKYCK